MTTTSTTPKPNRYAGRCACGTRVAAEAGFLGPKVDGRWTVQCHACLGLPVATAQDHPVVQLTEEQQHALDLFTQGHSIAVEAGAGTGKTSLLVALARSTSRTGTYTAFNASIVEDGAAKFPANVGCATSHSLAARQVGRPYLRRLTSPRMRGNDIARILDISPINVPVVNDLGEPAVKVLQPRFLAGHVMGAISTFCNTADLTVGVQHFSRIEAVEDDVNDRVHRDLLPALQAAWADLMNPTGRLLNKSTVHSTYFKVWQLGIHGPSGKLPVIPGDFILVDEAQDTNATFADVLAQQTVQLVAVGDSAQTLYEWRGSCNILSGVPAERRAMLTISWRFGQVIADAANLVLGYVPDSTLRLEGRGGPSTIGAVDDPKAILTRTNAAALRALMAEQVKGRRTYLIGGGKDTAAFCRAARDLQAGRGTDHPDLGCFETWGEVQAYVTEDESGADLALMVRLIDKHGVDELLKAVDAQTTEAAADVVVSTIHKVKGREWDTVRLGNDFAAEALGSRTEAMLLYVGVTRARLTLDVTGCEPVAKLLNAIHPNNNQTLEG